MLPPARAADVEFVRVWPGWKDDGSFRRISEYFTGRENTAGILVRRSQPGSRSGYYFLVRVRHPGVPLDGARFVVHYITPLSPEPREKAFPADAGPGEQVFDLGLTGADWAGATTHPLAWRLDLVAADGRMLASSESFLWSKPSGVHD